ncbi:MAG TPA: amino acid adenylation domain-containing protein [Thermoanaerobaculia bacterium]
MAWSLAGLGVGPEQRVGIFLERSAAMVASILGVLKAGGAYVPLDPGYPASRVGFMLEDSGTSVVVTEERLAAALPAGGARVTTPAELEAAAASERSLPGTTTPQNLAYVIYTSGSTGRPKGVAVHHEGLSNLVWWHREEFGLTGADRSAHVAGLGFDASVWELWPPLTCGAGLHLAPEAVRTSAEQVWGWLESEGITVAFLPTPLAEAVLDLERAEAAQRLRVLLTGGDRLRLPTAWTGDCLRLVNNYGPTECTVVATSGEVRSGSGAGSLPSIGRPIANARAYAADRRGWPVGVGVPGELLLGGEGLARGYLGRPDLTAERFVPDPFGSSLGGRLYRTGDLVRWRPDGELEFLGRTDHQVKVRGFRIELGEVEAVLRAHPAVREAVAVVRGDEAAGPRLVAYAVGTTEPPVSVEALRAWLAERVPAYMVPSALVLLESLPLTPSGKVDRGALPAPVFASSGEAIGAAGGGARDPIEELLAAVWAEVLGVERVGVHDDFFALGGHSLLAMRLVAQLRNVLGMEVPVRSLFEHPTVVGLAAVIGAGRMAELPPIEVVPRGCDLPLSFAQERLWFIDALEPGTATYNIPGAIHLSGELDAAALAASLGAVVRRHEVLRTTLPAVDGQPVQQIQPALPPSMPAVDLMALPEPHRRSAAVALMQAEARQPFDLAQGPVCRVTLVRLTADEHLLLITMHHAVADAWSLDILMSELAEHYEAARQGASRCLPELPVQYADFAVWQRQWLAGDVLEAQLAYWRERLASLPVIDLPADRPRPAVQSSRGGQASLCLEGGLAAASAAFAQRQRATRFMVSLSAFTALLARYTGLDDVAVGTPVANRRRIEVERSIGLFANTLVLRAAVAADQTFAELVSQVRETTLDAFAHQDLPFERLVQELAPERSLGRSPLFQILFALRSAPPRYRPGGLEMRPLEVDTGTAKFDLGLFVIETADGLKVAAEYSLDLFDRARIERLLSHLATLLAAAVSHPELRVSELPLLAESERCQVVGEWNDTQHAGPCELAHERVAAQAERTPEAIAVELGERTLTYAELVRRTDRLAARLRALGAGPDVPVGLAVARSPELVVGVLGILRAGAAYVPLDASYPRERREFILRDAGARLLVTAGDVDLPGEAVLAVRLDDEAEEDGGGVAAPVPAGSDHLAYIIYTSGSTGVPKGVALTHGALANLLRWQRESPALSGPARTLQFAPIGFDVSFQEIFSALGSGGCLVMISEEERRDPRALLRTLDERAVERLFMPFVALQQLAEAALDGVVPGALRAVVTAGEQLQVGPAVVALFSRLPGCRLHNQYGPSETHVVSEHVLAGPPDRWPALPPIGRPIASTCLYILDHGRQPAPVGVPGELVIGGVALARGYAGRPALTAERFVPDPFGEAPGGRLYCTGDLARWRAEGEIEFLGRIDHQVKVRGFRVEPGEIEAVLRQARGVREAVVVAHGSGIRRLVAYVMAGAGAIPSVSELRAWLRERLPDYMIPSAFVVLDALPLTPSGKVDRRALPAPQAAAVEEKDAATPRTPTEELLAQLWSSLLGCDRVAPGDNFFELGGHSLLAAQATWRVRELFGIELPVRVLFESPTLADLARRIDAGRREGTAPEAPPVRPLPRGVPLPVSFAQERLWFLHQFDSESAAYNLPGIVEIQGALDPTLLALCIDRLTERHEALRTVFSDVEGRPVQVVLAASRRPLPSVDLSGLPSRAREAEAHRIAFAEARRPFDLTRGPLLRATLIRLGERAHRLLLSMHHIVSDGWSIGIMLRELVSLLASPLESLAALPVQYADYAAWQREWLRGEVLAAHLAYWRGRLAGSPLVLELPADRPRPPVLSQRGGKIDVTAPANLAAALDRFCRERRVTRFMALFATFGALLARYTGRRDLVIGTPVANRGVAEVEGVVGLFVNTLALRCTLAPDAPALRVLDEVRAQVLEAFAHQDLPFEKLVEALLSERDLSHSPIFQVLLGLQEDLTPAQELPGLSLASVELDTGTSRFDLSLNLGRSRAGTLAASLSYNRDLFDRSTGHRMVRHFLGLLQGLLDKPELPWTALPLLDESELQQILRAWNDTRVEPPAIATIHGQIEEQARRSPGAPAIVFRDRCLTYADLSREAGRLASRLQALGVGPDVAVGICLERSPEMVIAMLAVLQAGGCYLPLDPSYPSERLRFMLEDSGAPVLVTTRRLAALLPDRSARVLALDDPSDEAPNPRAAAAAERPVHGDGMAYVIYTSGSTGRPKGVMVSHANLVNFFAALDDRIGCGPADTLLAVTSINFDISTLELLWTLARGARVVLQPGRAAQPAAAHAERAIDFSLFYFASEETAGDADKYRLLLEGAKFADRHGFSAVWTPERHFHAFGGIYPNPSVVGAAVAAITQRIAIRAGSVVLPLHSPLRIAEEWSVVDNLSRGRVGVSFASGWHADDFVLAPNNYTDRKEVLFRGIETVRALWRGEAVRLPGGAGNEVEVRIHPRPVQSELPMWVTAAGNPETFREAGAIGAGVLTHLLGQSLEELEEKIAVYRQAYREAGHGPGEGHVVLMLHTFVGDDEDEVRAAVRLPFREYLRSSVGLMRNLARSLGQDDPRELMGPDMEALLDHACERYFESSALFGTPESCLRMVDRLKAIGVDEAACLIDFGVDAERALSSLERLYAVRLASQPAPPGEMADEAVPAQILRHGATLLQCTPSMARMIAEAPGAAEALHALRALMVGGEALPPDLAGWLARELGGDLHNMYGPTETTVWSTTQRISRGAPVSIGRPIHNTTVYVLDSELRPVPIGVAGELFIGGLGVARGYLGRPELTAERFVPDALGDCPGGRLYRTGDVARFLPDGTLDYLGRVDSQVKIRGYRIELAEIEATLAKHPAVREAAVAVREDQPGDRRLVAYVVPQDTALASRLRPVLPDPQAFLAGRASFTLPNGLPVASLSDMQTNQLYREIFENELYLRHGVTLRDGDCVFDVGANIGFFSLFVHHKVAGAKVFSFEPIPDTYATLRANVELYGLDVTAHPFGLSSREETAELTFYPRMAGLSGRYSTPEADRLITKAVALKGLGGDQVELDARDLDAILAEQFESRTVVCRLRTLSDVIDESGTERIDLLKVDVEKAELDVLTGIRDEHWPRIHQVALEVDTREHLEAITDLLAARGFAVAVDELIVIPASEETVAVDVYMVYARREGVVPESRPIHQPVAPAARQEGDLSARTLRDFLQRSLPEYMLPAAFVPLPALPLTPNGKIDRRALPAPDRARMDAGTQYVAPRTELERGLASLWRELLGLERVGVDDNFFEIGGNSMLIAQARTRMREVVGVEVSLVDLFRYPTVGSLAHHLSTAPDAGRHLEAVRERGTKMKQAIKRQRKDARSGRNR